MARVAPMVRKEQLKLKGEKLTLQHKIADSKEKLAKVNEQLKALSPRPAANQE